MTGTFDRRRLWWLLLAWLVVPAAAEADPEWTFRGEVVDGGQLDAVRGPGNRIHLISSRYYQLDETGVVVVEEDLGDERQGSMDFPPAIAVGDDGSVHIVTRHGGDFASGHELRYRRRNAAGAWDLDYSLGSPAPRNYVVAVAWAGAGQLHLLSSEVGSDVWGPLHLFDERGGRADPAGDLDDVWRGDTDARLRGHAGTVYFVSGRCDPDGTAFFSWGAGGSGLRDRLASQLQRHESGTGRRGFPDLYVDATGGVHFVYGAQHELYYNRYGADGARQFADDVRVFDGLGDWHLSTGLGAVAGADDGRTVAAVALRSDGSAGAGNAELLWSVSTDGGATWTAPVSSGRTTDGGEGRRRPRIVALGRTFYVFYWDNDVSGLSLATLAVPPDEDGDGYPADVDCDDTLAAVNPGAAESCGNGRDDDCDGATDEGCGLDADAGDDAGPPGDDGAMYDDGADSPDETTPRPDGGYPVPVQEDEGCGCRATGADRGAIASLHGALLAALVWRSGVTRRRR